MDSLLALVSGKLGIAKRGQNFLATSFVCDLSLLIRRSHRKITGSEIHFSRQTHRDCYSKLSQQPHSVTRWHLLAFSFRFCQHLSYTGFAWKPVASSLLHRKFCQLKVSGLDFVHTRTRKGSFRTKAWSVQNCKSLLAKSRFSVDGRGSFKHDRAQLWDILNFVKLQSLVHPNAWYEKLFKTLRDFAWPEVVPETWRFTESGSFSLGPGP